MWLVRGALSAVQFFAVLIPLGYMRECSGRGVTRTEDIAGFLFLAAVAVVLNVLAAAGKNRLAPKAAAPPDEP